MSKKKTKGIYSDLDKEVSKLIDKTEDMNELLVLWKAEDEASKLNSQRVDRIKNKIRAFLKERQWDRYDDKDTKISVSLTTMKRQSIDKEQLKMILTENQMAQITRVTTSETMRIITPELRDRMKKFVK